MIDQQIKLFKVPVPSTSFLTEAAFFEWKTPLSIWYEFQRDGVAYRSGIRFSGVAATRTRAERCSTIWQIESAYDTLVEVQDSTWAKEIRADTSERWRDEWEMHHYMIYLDSAGCLEVIADSWEALPEERGTWD